MIELAPANPYGLSIASPVIAAAGCLGYGVEYQRVLDLTAFGAIITRTTTLHPRRTAPPLALETPGGLLSVGDWPNSGIERVLDRYAASWETLGVPVIVSITASTAHEWSQLAAAVEGVPGISGLEVQVFDAPERAPVAIKAVRSASQLPLLVKLPMVDEQTLLQQARACVDAGADALTVAVWMRGSRVVASSIREGWLSGPALLPVALRLSRLLTEAVSVPVMAGGGVASADDVRQLLQTGATGVQVGALLLGDAWRGARIARELHTSHTSALD